MRKHQYRRPKTAVLSVVVLSGALLLGACAPDLGAMPSPKPLGSYQSQQSFANSFAAEKANWPQGDWWTTFHDPELSRLIGEGLAGAPDLKIAEARMRVAYGGAEAQGAPLWPSLSADAGTQQIRQSLNTGFPAALKSILPHGWHTSSRASLDLGYELDFFGKNRAALAAATSEADAARADLAAARLALSTAIASAYADLVRLTADQHTAEDAVRVREESAKLVAARVQNGLENEGQLAQARAETAIAQGRKDVLDGQIAHTRNQIAALLGKGPDRGLHISPPATVDLQPFGLPPTLPADLVGRRPDIVAARLRVEAAAQNVHVARAAYYPNIDLTASIGLQALSPSQFINHDSIIGAVGPALHLPIFEGGRLGGNYRGARGRYDEAVAVYDKTLTHALKTIADAVADQRALSRQLADARKALSESEKAYRVAQLRYRGGLTPYLTVLTAEGTLLDQRRAAADLNAQGFQVNIALIRALGGGFHAPAQAPAPAANAADNTIASNGR
jgi:NodT family efflux transporter outer membrane factor (OMF) lipoprotein